MAFGEYTPFSMLLPPWTWWQHTQFSSHSFPSCVSTHSFSFAWYPPSPTFEFSSLCNVPPGSSSYIQAPNKTGPFPFSLSSLTKTVSHSMASFVHAHVSFFSRTNHSWWELLLLELFHLFHTFLCRQVVLILQKFSSRALLF